MNQGEIGEGGINVRGCSLFRIAELVIDSIDHGDPDVAYRPGTDNGKPLLYARGNLCLLRADDSVLLRTRRVAGRVLQTDTAVHPRTPVHTLNCGRRDATA